jgi:hypothetical protein
MREKEKHLQAIGDWAGTLPPEAWTPGAPTDESKERFFAVKTQTGRILTGTGRAFRIINCWKIAAQPKYGPITHFMEAGD